MAWSQLNVRTTVCVGFVLAFVASGCAQPAAKVAAAPAAPVYDTTADAKVQIAAALTKAKQDNQRVLLMFGGNWCPWCLKLHALFKDNKDIAKTLLYEYQFVTVDIGRYDKHMDVVEGYGADLKKNGVPFLTVLDADGKVLANQETGVLEAGDHHDPAKVGAFLAKWKAEPRDARTLMANAQKLAASQQKLIFVRLGAPWCPWCRKFDDFVARPDIAAALAPDFVTLKIDMDRCANAAEVAERFRTADKGGLPWFALLGADGKALATADGPDGNVGFPAKPEEIQYFMGVLKKHAKRMSAAQFDLIEQGLMKAEQERGR